MSGASPAIYCRELELAALECSLTPFCADCIEFAFVCAYTQYVARVCTKAPKHKCRECIRSDMSSEEGKIGITKNLVRLVENVRITARNRNKNSKPYCIITEKSLKYDFLQLRFEILIMRSYRCFLLIFHFHFEKLIIHDSRSCMNYEENSN